MAATHDTVLELLSGPPADHIFEPGETFRANVAVLSQNHSPNTITQISLYISPRGGKKEVCELINGCQGVDPDVRKFEIEYIVPRDIKCARNNNAILEFGWDEELQYTGDDVIRRFQRRGQEQNLLFTLLVAQRAGVRYDFKVDLYTPMPKLVVAGDTLRLDLVSLLQNNYPGALSQIFVYFKNMKSGAFDFHCIQNMAPGRKPPLLRGEVAYDISEKLVGQTLEIGWGSDLQYNFQDAVNNFNKKPKGHLLGHVKVMKPDHPDAAKVRLQVLSAGSTTPKSIPKKMQEYVAEYFSDTGESRKDLAKCSEYATKQGPKKGTHHLVATEVPIPIAMVPKSPTDHEVPKSPTDHEVPKSPTDRKVPKSPTDREVPKSPTDHEVPKSPTDREVPKSPTDREVPKSPTDREVPKSPTDHDVPKSPTDHEVPKPAAVVGLQVVTGTNPAALAVFLGEMLGSYAGGKLGKILSSEEAGRNTGGLAGAVVVRVAYGSIVPGAVY